MIFTLSEKDFVYSIIESQSIIITIDTKYFTKYNESLTIFQKEKQKIPIDIQHNLLQIIKNNFNDIFRKIGIESLILDSICKLGTNELQLQEDNQKVKFSGLANVEKINLARKLIVEHLSEHLTIPIIALEVGTNQSYLKIGFKKMYGQTIFEFIQSTRMQTAKELLKRQILLLQLSPTKWVILH
ncbi:AraC family transcriptional regulator [Chryseobacterium sp. POE27]|uniref:helix-turn-helix domain-containing protein n=1 Tax=Chryseobacterium sp. POE27 TaxID=3138177 RepID=UPI00321ABE37